MHLIGGLTTFFSNICVLSLSLSLSLSFELLLSSDEMKIFMIRRKNSISEESVDCVSTGHKSKTTFRSFSPMLAFLRYTHFGNKMARF
jgi:hypothetical protein